MREVEENGENGRRMDLLLYILDSGTELLDLVKS